MIRVGDYTISIEENAGRLIMSCNFPDGLEDDANRICRELMRCLQVSGLVVLQAQGDSTVSTRLYQALSAGPCEPQTERETTTILNMFGCFNTILENKMHNDMRNCKIGQYTENGDNIGDVSMGSEKKSIWTKIWDVAKWCWNGIVWGGAK